MDQRSCENNSELPKLRFPVLGPGQSPTGRLCVNDVGRNFVVNPRLTSSVRRSHRNSWRWGDLTASLPVGGRRHIQQE